MFGNDALGLASTYFNMDATPWAAWIAENPALWAQLLKFRAWLMKQIGVTSEYAVMLKSIPTNANIPSAPPVPGEYPGRQLP